MPGQMSAPAMAAPAEASPPSPAPLGEWRGGDLQAFRREVIGAYEPMVLRGLGADWPAVAAARRSPEALADYLRARDRGGAAEAFRGPPSIKGRFFYSDDLQGFNFQRGRTTLSAALAEVIRLADVAEPDGFYLGAAPLQELAPEAAREHANPLAPQAEPRLWIGGRTVITTHYDVSHNIACVVAGRRRFTLFPPDQVRNLYVGPIERTVAGQPVSLARPDRPDLARFPRLAEALAAARSAELAPGDAVYVPPLWWHHVEALEPINVLLNFWWEEGPPDKDSPFDAMVHGLLAIAALPEAERRAWRAFFDHYVFRTDGEDPAAHIPPAARGVLEPSTPAVRRSIRQFLVNGLGRRLRP